MIGIPNLDSNACSSFGWKKYTINVYIYIHICTYFSPEDQENPIYRWLCPSVMEVNLLASFIVCLLSPCKTAAISAQFLEGQFHLTVEISNVRSGALQESQIELTQQNAPSEKNISKEIQLISCWYHFWDWSHNHSHEVRATKCFTSPGTFLLRGSLLEGNLQ